MIKTKIRIFIISIFILFLVLVCFAFYTFHSISEKNEVRPCIYLVIKTIDQNVSFWQSVKKGAELASIELKLNVVTTGSKEEINVVEQQNILKDIIKINPDAVILASADYDKLQKVVERIIEKGINLITIDSDVKTKYEHSFVATNNFEASKEAANEMAKVLGYEGKVAIMTHYYASTTAKDREKGFKKQMSTYPNIKVIDRLWDCESDEKKAYSQTLELLEQYPDVTGIFGSNEVTIQGIARAVKEKGLEGKIKLIGFDSNEKIIQLIEEGTIDGVIVQKPFNMGYFAVNKAVEEIRNISLEKEFIDTGSVLIDKDNIYEPENQKLIFPFAK